MSFMKTPMMLLAAAVIAMTSGCIALAVGAAAGVGTYAYVEGIMKTTLEANLDRTWDATQKSVEQLQFTVKSSSKDALQAKLVAREANNTDVKIYLERKGDNLTEVSIRVGVFGDEAQSRLILDKIKQNL
jgi:Protein of unknown function (DUF3568)